jgi:hypothetical protein
MISSFKSILQLKLKLLLGIKKKIIGKH